MGEVTRIRVYIKYISCSRLHFQTRVGMAFASKVNDNYGCDEHDSNDQKNGSQRHQHNRGGKQFPFIILICMNSNFDYRMFFLK